MALVKCKECGNQVSDKAKACPSCGAKPKKTVGTFAGLVIIGVAIFIFTKMFSSGSPTGSSPTAVDRCSNTTMAFVMSQNFVKKRLKSPASAEFPYISDEGVSVTKLPGCKFQVNAFVDSQNGFGALIRTRYTATLESMTDGKTWTAHNVTLQ